MQIVEMRVMRGPNYWSIRKHKLIVLKIDLQELEELPTNKIEGFGQRLEKLIPSLKDHHCSEGREGGFLFRVEEGTWIGHVIEHIALEIQTLAGMECSFGRTRSTGEKGVYHVVFAYSEEEVGIYAAEAAIRIVEALIKGEEYDLQRDLQEMRDIRARVRFGPTTHSIIEEARARDIPFIRLNGDSLIQLGYGKNQVRFRASITDRTSSIAVDIAANKEETKHILKAASIPVSDGSCISHVEDLDAELEKIGFPLVIKPFDGNHGKGTSINIRTREEAHAAFEYAKTFSKRVIIEKYIHGFDFRALVINNRLVAAALREPAHVIGDGKSTLKQLIDKENSDPCRGYGHENILTAIKVDRETEELLAKKKYTLDTVLAEGEKCQLKGTANLSTGGTSTDVTDSVHPHNVALFERIARIVGLDICGIDIVARDLYEPLERTGGVILEVNAAPGFRMHLAPSSGTPRNVAGPVLDMLYPQGKPCRIPIIAVTGTNGKTTTTRLIAHIVRNSGYRVGYTTSDGIYIGNSLQMEGDTTGPGSAEFILKDPGVDFAVLETARGGILRSGLAFDKCDIGVITNVQEDHIGLGDINTIEEMARVKSVVVESVKPGGYAVLNADNKYCVNAARGADCHIAYFSMHENNPVIKQHCRKGGIAAVCENGYITIKKGEWKFRVCKIHDIPLTFEGKVPFMIQNVLTATLAAYTYGIYAEDIASSLQTFIPSAATTPGRMNIYELKDFRVMVDFAHNPDGFRGVKEFVTTVNSPCKIGIITGTGDRRDEDLRELGRLSAQMFDHIIIRQDPNYLRGRTEEEIIYLLTEGIMDVNVSQSYEHIPADIEPLAHAINRAIPGSFIVALSAAVDDVHEKIRNYMAQERAGEPVTAGRETV